MRLSQDTLDRLAASVTRYGYRREAQGVGIVHFGIGAFHRAHQAFYTDSCLAAGESDWMACGVSLRSSGVAEQLNPQDGLYTLTEREGTQERTRVIGAVREVLVAAQDAERIVWRLADPACRIVSFTVTEKGYCRAVDGSLDLAAADKGFYPFLVRSFASRKKAGCTGLTLMSCDNMAHNGRQLQQLVTSYLEARAPDLLDWFATNCRCPSTMVDRIVPAVTDADRTTLAEHIGVLDEGAVFTEAFSQWVIEDSFAAGRPSWDAHGAELVGDVAPYEDAKLRMLNGAHSLIAYAGLMRGHAFVHQAVADPELAPLVGRLLRLEAAPTIDTAPGQDLDEYASLLEGRFADPALNHRLAQIAMDGSQKIPQRWLATLARQQQAGVLCEAILTGLSAWIRHIADGRYLDDPHSAMLVELWQRHGGEGIVDALFGTAGMFSQYWTPDKRSRAFLTAKLGAWLRECG